MSPRVAEVCLTGTGMSRCKHTEVWAQVSAGSAHAGLPQAPLHSTNRSDDLQSCGCSGFLSNFVNQTLTCSPHSEAVFIPWWCRRDCPAWPMHTATMSRTVLTVALALARVACLFLSCRPFSSHSWEAHFGHH